MTAASNRTVLVLNGPNLNLLGKREPHIYGSTTLTDVEQRLHALADELGLTVEFRQSNWEGQIIDWIQEARERGTGILINPAGFTSTSIAILDALLASERPIVEVHVTNIHKREEFRHMSYVSKAADAVIAGAGPHGYELGLRHLDTLLGNAQPSA
ncbi:type II 3-dehydroquinate dehydratase [Ruicaihuangia caeni]|uniref:3-dehydroquinate dehydratase n=1 Tax=Ruicaihuangia caeni TaxID=3042517 RepID=A0AAW6TAR0_9MICO|nr:type II 3-dehydroquinate dehydratase [Klugiella sp. YN-L-19]MDI2098415.1 type II 3-dehydroquinate dehydratase [Klugiella sp. YN-L-19]